MYTNSRHCSMLILLHLTFYRNKATFLQSAQARVLEWVTNFLSRSFGKSFFYESMIRRITVIPSCVADLPP